MSVTEALFAPLYERQLVRATQATETAIFNDSLLEIALTYLDLVRAQSRVAIARETVKNADRLVQLVGDRVKNGVAPPADGLRSQGELARRRREQLQAEEAVYAVSAELVRLLRLEPGTTLQAADVQPAPIPLVDCTDSLPNLLSQGIASRPEMAANQALVNATLARLRQEQWRPFLPNLQVGLSAGGFGGGRSPSFGNFNDRTDFDALAVWEIRNLGFGNRALQRDRASVYRQANLSAEQIRDLIIAEITRAYYGVPLRQKQIEAAQAEVQATAAALPLNFKGIEGGVLRAIEAQQAIQALEAAQTQYLHAVTEFNRAQFELLRALGKPPCGQLP